MITYDKIILLRCISKKKKKIIQRNRNAKYEKSLREFFDKNHDGSYSKKLTKNRDYIYLMHL